jgi:hypothetical protein
MTKATKRKKGNITIRVKIPKPVKFRSSPAVEKLVDDTLRKLLKKSEILRW